MNAIDFYRSILPAAGLESRTTALPVPVENNIETVEVSNIWYMLGNEPEVLKVEDSIVVLPERSLLRLGIPESVIAFHPVCESPLRKDSAMFTRIQRCIMIRMNYLAAELIQGIAEFAATNEKHITASPAQAQFLADNSKIDAKTLKLVSSVLKKLRLTEPTERLISINTRRNVPRDDRSHARGCLVNFPINEFRIGEKILGVSVTRERDRESFYTLLDWIFPENTTLNAYSGYSDDLKAPSLAALLTAAGKVYSRINSVVDIFASQLTDPQSLKTDLTFLAGIDNLAKFRNELGELPGNLGDPLDTKNEGESVDAVIDRFAIPKEVARPKAPVQAAPVAATVLPPPAPAPQPVASRVLPPAKPLAASVVGALPAAKTPTPRAPAQPQKTWLDLQEENRRQQMALQPQVQQQMVMQPQYVAQQPMYGQPVQQVNYMQAQLQQQQPQYVQVIDPATGQYITVPAQAIMQQQPQMVAQPQYVQQQPIYGQQQYMQQPVQQPVNTNGFQAYGPAPVPQGYGYAAPNAYGMQAAPVSPGRANAMARGYGRRY